MSSSPLGNLFSQAFLTYFFATGGFLFVLNILYGSFVIWPATKLAPIISDDFPVLMLAILDKGMRIMFIIGAPIVAVMFVAEFALAIVSRFAPQLQVFILAMPIKSLLAIFMLIFYFSTLLPYVISLETDFYGYTQRLYEVLRFGEFDPDADPVARNPMSGGGGGGASTGEKTEQPTPKRLRDSRKKGQVARSQEVVTSASLMSVILYLWLAWDDINNWLIGLFDQSATLATVDFQSSGLDGLWLALRETVIILLPIIGVTIVAGIAANYFQFGSIFAFRISSRKWRRSIPQRV